MANPFIGSRATPNEDQAAIMQRLGNEGLSPDEVQFNINRDHPDGFNPGPLENFYNEGATGTGDPLRDAIYRGLAQNQDFGQGHDDILVDQFYQHAPAAGLSATSDWSGLFKNARQQQVSRFGSDSQSDRLDPLQVASKFFSFNNLPNSAQITNTMAAQPWAQQGQAAGAANIAADHRRGQGAGTGVLSIAALVAAMFGGAGALGALGEGGTAVGGDGAFLGGFEDLVGSGVGDAAGLASGGGYVDPYGGAGAESFLEAPIDPQTGIPKWATPPTELIKQIGNTPASGNASGAPPPTDPYGGSLTGQAADLKAAFQPMTLAQRLSAISSPRDLMRLLGDSGSIAKGALVNDGSAWGTLGNIGSGINTASSLYGLYTADRQRKMAELAAKRADPWGDSGGRDAAGRALQGVLFGGSQAYQNTPSYQARMQAVQRRMAASGYNLSGNDLIAAADASGAGYDQYVQQMAGLAGANQNPATAQTIAQSGNNNAAATALGSLSLLGKTLSSSNWFQ